MELEIDSIPSQTRKRLRPRLSPEEKEEQAVSTF